MYRKTKTCEDAKTNSDKSQSRKRRDQPDRSRTPVLPRQIGQRSRSDTVHGGWIHDLLTSGHPHSASKKIHFLETGEKRTK
jgi:hypothetical protein